MSSVPNHQRWHANWKLSPNMRTLRTRLFACCGSDLHAQPVLGSKISASELSRTFIESALLVGVPHQKLDARCVGRDVVVCVVSQNKAGYNYLCRYYLPVVLLLP